MRFSLALVGLMLALPFLQPRHTNPVTSYYSEWLAFVIGAAALFPLAMRRYSTPLKVPTIAFTPLAMVAVLVLHLVLMKSPYPQQPLLAIVYLVWGAALVLLAAAVRAEFGLDRAVAVLAGFAVAGGLLNTVAGVLQHYEWRGPLEAIVATKLYYQVYGNLGQPNHFATQIVLALVSLGFLHSTGHITRKWAVVAVAPMLFVLALSGSRSAWLYLVAVAAFAAISHRFAPSVQTRRAMKFALALIPGLAIANVVAELPWLAPPTLQQTVVDRIFSLASTQSQRLHLWREAWSMFLGAPLLGVGWGQFAWHNFMLTGETGGAGLTGLYNHAHNILMQLLAETGIVGAAILLVGVVAWLRSAWPLLKCPPGWWIWACAAVLGVHSMLEYPLWNAYFLGVACVVLGLGDLRTVELHQARLVRLGIGAFIAGTAWIGGQQLDSYRGLERVLYSHYSEHDRSGLQQAHREMLAVRRSFFLAPYVDLAYARDLPLNMADIDRKLAFAARVMRFAPTGLLAYRFAALNALAGNEAEAREILRRAALAYPTLLDSFTREFMQADTGNRVAQAKFLSELRAYSQHQQARDAWRPGDENGHILPKRGAAS